MKCKILIGEDDYEDQLILEDFFQQRKMLGDVKFARNGRNILEILDAIVNTKSLPSLIVLDLNMPILDGKDTLILLKGNPKYQHIPVIVYSTSNNAEERTGCLEAGACDYLVKPVTVEEANKLIDRFVEYLSQE